MTVRHPAEEAMSERIRQTTERLTAEFGAQFTPQAVERIAHESFEMFSSAPVLEFVPLLVERYARERLLATLQGQAS